MIAAHSVPTANLVPSTCRQMPECRTLSARSSRITGANMLASRRSLFPLAVRCYSTHVYAATASPSAPVQKEDGPGVKAKLYDIFRGSPKPMTAAELWSLAEAKGVRSKRHMKMVLQDLRKRGWVVTKPGVVSSAKRDKAFRYELSQKTLTSPMYKDNAIYN